MNSKRQKPNPQPVKNANADDHSTIRSKPKEKEKSRCYVVGIGASAGGLETLRSIFGGLKDLQRMSLIVVQHLAPQHPSRLVEIMGHCTDIPVREVRDGDRPRPNTIFVTPPNADVTLENGFLRLSSPEHKVGPKPSIDRFFCSLAHDAGENTIGIILSGTGSDGSLGVRAIRDSGGITIAQCAESAKYDGMPRAAKQTGAIDYELTPEEIVNQLMRFNELTLKPSATGSVMGSGHRRRDPYLRILDLLESETRVNFKPYKQTTIRRRIDRRLVATRCDSLVDYVKYLKKNPNEVRLLFQDALISVTSFFRDEPSFRALDGFVTKRLREKAEGQFFRSWVVGCATGEEAYSIGILLLETLSRLKRRIPIQIFATDIDEEAMIVARKGIYPKGSLLHVPSKIREKYFDSQNDFYRAKDFLREMIVFARHDISKDPPFLKMDLISCRNLLIYFTPQLQEQVLTSFHFALDMSGMLFLGKSESIGSAGRFFSYLEKTTKIFERSRIKGEVPRSFSRHESRRESILMTEDRGNTSSGELFNSLVNGFAPDSVLLDREFRLKHVYGNSTQFLNLPKGPPTVSITKLVKPEMSLEVGTLLHRAERDRTAARGKQRYLKGAKKKRVELLVVPIIVSGEPDYLLCFQPIDELPRHKARLFRDLKSLPIRDRVKALEHELTAARESVQTIVEEHETAVEELQALNEELQSTNEELQSTNEELETTNEELQSANEELTTLNQELNVKSTEQLVLTQRFQAVQSAIYYPLLILDRNERLVDFNPPARYQFRISDMDRGQDIRALGHQFDIDPLVKLVGSCAELERDERLQLKTPERDFEVRAQLFRGVGDVTEGIVLSFVDNTDIVRALEEVEIHKARLSAIFENTPALVTMKDTVGVYTYVNKRFSEVLGMPPSELVGKTDEEIFGPDVGGELRERDFEVLKSRKSLTTEQMLPVQNRTHYWLSSKFPILDDKKKARSICSVSLDVTEKIIHERQLEIFKKVVSASSAGILIFEWLNGDYFVTLASDEFASKVKATVSEIDGRSLSSVLELFLGNTTSVDSGELEKSIRSGDSASFIVNLTEAQGRESWVELKASNMHLGKPELKYLILTFFDVNERIHTQRMLQSQQDSLAKFGKLASLGEVAAGISHEINTPLNVISTRTDLLRRLADREALDHSKIRALAGDIDGMVRSISQVISGLKSITGMDSEQRSPHDLVRLVREAIRICDFRIQNAGVKLTFVQPVDGEMTVRCYPVQIVQILINLINNAIDAVTELRDRWIRVEIEKVRDKVFVRVTDSGKGIDPSLSEKIMTPFFTTKSDRSGTGLGLSLSRSIARRHEGDLTLDPTPKNTSFLLELPSQLA